MAPTMPEHYRTSRLHSMRWSCRWLKTAFGKVRKSMYPRNALFPICICQLRPQIKPALSDFPCLIQCSEQVKIQYFSPVRPVEPLYKRVLCRFSRFNKFQHNTMVLSPQSQCQGDKFWSVIHTEL